MITPDSCRYPFTTPPQRIRILQAFETQHYREKHLTFILKYCNIGMFL